MKAYPLEEKWVRLKSTIAAQPEAPPVGVGREYYLDLAERIMRTAVNWQHESGMVIDPYLKNEANSGSARFVGALGQLIKAGRCLDLVDACIKSYEHCLSRLEEVASYPEFWTKELVYGWEALHDKIDGERRERWRQTWLSHDPRHYYGCVTEQLSHNFWVFALAGEFLKQKAGLEGDMDLVDEGIGLLLNDFTELGMYRDPNDPMIYDTVVTQQFALIMDCGYDGKWAQTIDELCRRAGLTSLLYQSATGQMPFGGRSNQYHFGEGHFSCLCESLASRCRRKGDDVMAAVFKRAARRAALSTSAWVLEMIPFRHLKQGFPPAMLHGIDAYGSAGVYALLAASLFGTAYHLADDTIEEVVTPAELGGYVVDLWPAFHKVFAGCGGYSIEIDTKADHHYDATGLGAVHKIDIRPETALSASLSHDANYLTNTTVRHTHASLPIIQRPGSLAVQLDVAAFEREIIKNLAFGPAWKDTDGVEHRLADFETEIEDVAVEMLCEAQEEVSFRVVYRGDLGACRCIVETYRIFADGIDYRATLDNDSLTPYLLVPLLKTDGKQRSSLQAGPNGFVVSYRDAVYRVIPPKGSTLYIRDDPAMPNRNALYLTGVIESERTRIVLATISE